MPYDSKQPSEPCTVCGSDANIHHKEYKVGEIVDCVRCGDFQISHVTAADLGLPFKDQKDRALASYVIRKMWVPGVTRPKLTRDFFNSLQYKALPTPAEAMDNFIIWVAGEVDGRPGKIIAFDPAHPKVLATVGVVGFEDINWIVASLRFKQLLLEASRRETLHQCYLTADGWQRFEELKRAHIASSYAFFARKFSNADLDAVFEKCLYPAVEQTGYKLRTVTQRAGLVDAVIEDEIRRCRFLIADLSDDNAGAYWEAGFAEGLGKPVIYICRTEVATHFDANHRHTVRWDLTSLDQTAARLKAVIRNTLLGDAKQTD